MSRLLLLSLLFSLPVAAPAAADAKEDDLELLRLKRLAMEAHVKLGNVYLKQGDADKARAELEAALRLHEGGGAGAASTPAIDNALLWLAKHQDNDGRWDADGFMKHDPAADRCDGAGGRLYDVGVTGLSVLALLGGGHTDRRGRHKAQVKRGLDFLIQSQDKDGCFGPRATHSFMYNTAIATIALCEAYRLTRDPRYKQFAEKALAFIMRARNPHMAWRYDPRGGENDTSVTAWCITAVRAGGKAKLEIDAGAFQGARAWMDKVTDANFGQAGYNYPGGACARPEGRQDDFPPEKSQAMTAAAIYTRMVCGEDPRRSATIQKGAQLCLNLLPTWKDPGARDMYYWFYGTLAMYQVGPREFAKWSKSLEEALLPSQRKRGARAGSWDPAGPWGRDGGRVYSTALMALTLQTNQRGRALLKAKRR